MMERLGCTFAGAPVLYGWHAVATWARHLPQGSAVWRAKHPKESAYSSDLGRANIAADQFDAILSLVGVIAAAHGARSRTPKPYPRPSAEDNTRHFGSGGIPVSEFDAWFYATD